VEMGIDHSHWKPSFYSGITIIIFYYVAGISFLKL